MRQTKAFLTWFLNAKTLIFHICIEKCSTIYTELGFLYIFFSTICAMTQRLPSDKKECLIVAHKVFECIGENSNLLINSNYSANLIFRETLSIDKVTIIDKHSFFLSYNFQCNLFKFLLTKWSS